MPKNKNFNIPASYLILLKKDHVLLLRRFNTGYEDGNYSLIAGHVEKGESFTQCMIREAFEEASITVSPQDLKVAHCMHRKSSGEERVETFFIVDKWIGTIDNVEPDKCDALTWFPVDNLPSNTIAYIKQAINLSFNQIKYSEYGW